MRAAIYARYSTDLQSAVSIGTWLSCRTGARPASIGMFNTTVPSFLTPNLQTDSG